MVSSSSTPHDMISLYGACEHNLQNLTLHFPQQQLVVITGLSGSGKSSLSFDTLYAEGQYRYAQTFSSYARSFIGELRRPKVDKIDGLSPVIAIEQKTTNRNPRSTVGTCTEIYDFLRVLYARVGQAYSQTTGKPLKKASEASILSQLQTQYQKMHISLLAPLVRHRKGHYRELLTQLYKQGYAKVYVDGELLPLTPNIRLDRFRNHEIAVAVAHVPVADNVQLQQALQHALDKGKGTCMVLTEGNNKPMYFSTQLYDADTGFSYSLPAPNTFSFNTPQGACPVCRGLGYQKQIDGARLMPDKQLSVAQGGIPVLGPAREKHITFRVLGHMLQAHRFTLATPLQDLPEEVLMQLLYGEKGNTTGYHDIVGKETLTDLIEGYGMMGWLMRLQIHGKRADGYLRLTTCTACMGNRLRPEALQFKVDGKHIAEVATWPLVDLHAWLKELPPRLNKKTRHIASELLQELATRTALLVDLGLHYLTLHRPIGSLSGGEAQRTRLATQIGNQLVGVMYILDEPSIGLHARDNARLITSLKQLRDMGNSVLVVEHDKDMMLQSDYLIDMGPGAGAAGGQVVAAGLPSAVMQTDTLTAQYLSNRKQVPQPSKRRHTDHGHLHLIGATGHNLKAVHMTVPLGRISCLTGVSGSGKSTLIHHTLVPILKQHFYNSFKEPLPYTKLAGIELLDKVIEVNQRPIGRTSRSNPATYTGVFTDIRALYAQLPEARLRGYGMGRFSFNVRGGRCETCQGGGIRLIEMDFLPDVHVPCEACLSKRYNESTLEVRYEGHSIADVLDMSMEDVAVLFKAHPIIKRKIDTLRAVGLGYLSLGQHATTLSGGEAQRIKLATELLRRDTGRTLYVLDEPTTGLHFEDITHLLTVLQRLVDKGNTVLIIEHNLEVIAACDYLIDLGPEGGVAGGMLVDEGTPEEVAQRKKGPTGQYLARVLTAGSEKT